MHGSDGELLDDSQNETTPRRQSFLEKIFGRKSSSGMWDRPHKDSSTHSTQVYHARVRHRADARN